MMKKDKLFECDEFTMFIREDHLVEVFSNELKYHFYDSAELPDEYVADFKVKNVNVRVYTEREDYQVLADKAIEVLVGNYW